MLLYNTTFGIDASIEKEFLHWIRTRFIPSAIGLDGGGAYFAEPEILRVMACEPGSQSFAVHFRAESKSDIDNWYADYGSKLFSELIERWSGAAVYFNTTLEVL